VGVYYNQPLWDETVYGWQGDAARAPLQVHTPRQWHANRALGLSLSNGRTSLIYMHYVTTIDPVFPALFKGADTVMIVWRFKP
jgi:hypothetical protein